MKKTIITIFAIMLLMSCGICLFACNSEADGQLVPEGREVEAATFSIANNAKTYSLSSDEIDTLTALLKSCDALEKDEPRIFVGKEKLDKKYDYTLNISLKKKFLKKAETYVINVGCTSHYTNTIGKQSSPSYTKLGLYRSGYNGVATKDLRAFVDELAKKI